MDTEPLELNDEQKRRLRAVKRGYRVEKVDVLDNGWKLKLTYLDGSSIVVNSKLVKLKAEDLA